MPSVKSYQNRKREIDILKSEVEELNSLLAQSRAKGREQYEEICKLSRSSQEADLFKQRLTTSEECRNNLFKELQATKCQRDLDHIALVHTQEWNGKIIDALSNQVQELERKVRIYRQYIRYGEAFYPEHYTYTIEPPACLKPLDALKWFTQIQERL